MQELLSIAVGPRTDVELPAGSQVKALLHRARDTLACRKVRRNRHKSPFFKCELHLFSVWILQFQTAVSEQMLLNSTVLLACKLGKKFRPLTTVLRQSGGLGHFK